MAKKLCAALVLESEILAMRGVRLLYRLNQSLPHILSMSLEFICMIFIPVRVFYNNSTLKSAHNRLKIYCFQCSKKVVRWLSFLETGLLQQGCVVEIFGGKAVSNEKSSILALGLFYRVFKTDDVRHGITYITSEWIYFPMNHVNSI